MISISPLTEVALPHRALHVAAANSGHIVAMSKEGAGTLLGPDHLRITPFDVGCHVKGLSISSGVSLLAVLEDDALSLVHLQDFIESHRLDGVFAGCLFSPSGNLLWTAKRVSDEVVGLDFFETKTWQVIARSEVEDPFGDSGLMLFAHPSDTSVVSHKRLELFSLIFSHSWSSATGLDPLQGLFAPV